MGPVGDEVVGPDMIGTFRRRRMHDPSLSQRRPRFGCLVGTLRCQLGAKTLFIEPGSPWENGYCGYFNGKLRDELLNGAIFYSLKEAKIMIERWRKYYIATTLLKRFTACLSRRATEPSQHL
jgi:hypothetical protein